MQKEIFLKKNTWKEKNICNKGHNIHIELVGIHQKSVTL